MMCSAFTPGFRYDKSITKLFGIVYCPSTMYSVKLSLQKKTFQSLDRSDYHCPQSASTCQLLNNPSEEQTNSIFLKFRQGIIVFEETQKSTQDVIEDVLCLTCPKEKCVYLSTKKVSIFFRPQNVLSLLSRAEYSF